MDCDSAWNELLREQVPNLFLQALHTFKQLPAAHADTPMAWVNRWLQSIPLPREVRTHSPLLYLHDTLWSSATTHNLACISSTLGCRMTQTPIEARAAPALGSAFKHECLACSHSTLLKSTWPACHLCPLQAQSFFAALPHSLAARLQQSQCIPTEANHWVYPRQALVCQDPQVRTLLANPRLPAVVTLQYAHSGLPILHSSQPLRALLGVGEVAHGHLLDVLRQLHASSGLAQMGQAWLAQLLLCIFDSLQQEQPGMDGYGGPSYGPRATPAAKAATADLKKLLLLPLADGSFAAVESEHQQTMYFPIDMDDAEGK